MTDFRDISAVRCREIYPPINTHPMNDDRQSVYLNLIEELLNCPSSEEAEILNANSELVDTGLVEMMTQVAATLTERGDENAANFLQSLATQLTEIIDNSSSTTTPQAYLDFLLEVLQATSESNGDAQVVYPLLQANLEKLNLSLANILENWATATLPDLELEQAKSIAADIVNFSNQIQEFPLGNIAHNLEIAIAGYGIALTVFTRERFPQAWAMTQNNLGTAYSDRIRGEKAENLEAAIACYREALKEYTRERFPQNHTETLFNLGLVYRETKQFQEAYNTLKAACDTVEFLRDEIISGEEAKQKLAEEWNNLYQNMVQVCLELHDYPQAIEYIERSKTRNLAELILTRDIHSIFPPKIVSQLQELGEEIAGGQKQIQTGKAENPKVLAQSLVELRQQRNELQNRYLPIGSGFKFQQLQRTLDEHTAIIQWYVMGDKFLTFID